MDLSNQKKVKDEVSPKFDALKTEMEKRWETWERLTPDARVKWIKDGKDPILTLSWDMYQYLNKFFWRE